MNKEISPVIISAVELMKKVNEGLEIEFSSGMKRVKESSYYPLGQLGVSTKMTYFEIKKNVFLPYQICEDMLNPIGNLIALDFVMSIFKDDIAKKFSNFNFEFNSNSDE